jgi:uncharacterized membrane protein
MIVFETRALRWLAIGLFVSIGVNLFLGGLVVGRWFAGEPPRIARFGGEFGNAPDRFTQTMLRRMSDALPSQHREQFDAVMRERRREADAHFEKINESRRRVREALGAERFDRAALEAASADLRLRQIELQKTLQDGIIAAAAQLPPEARRSLADWAGRHEARRPR